MSMGIALMLDQCELPDPRIGLTQLDTDMRGKPYHRARFNSLASVGNITAFGCTVVSTTTRAKSLGFIASVRVATDKLSWMSAVSFASPIRCRHRVSDERSNGSRCWKNSSPQKNWK